MDWASCALRLGVIGLVARELGHGLGERREEWLLVDHEEDLAFLHVGAVDELPLGEEAFDPRPDIHGLHGDEGPHELPVERHALLNGRHDLQRRRRRRRGLLLALARREQEEPGEHGDAPSAGRGEPGHFRPCSSLARSSLACPSLDDGAGPAAGIAPGGTMPTALSSSA